MWRCGKANQKRQSITDNILYYACAEEMYNIVMRAHINTDHGGRDNMLMRAHMNTDHGGRDKMLTEVNKQYANVTRDVLNLFKEMCEECQLKKKEK